MPAGVLNSEELINVLFNGDNGHEHAWSPQPPEGQRKADGSAVDLPLGNRYFVAKASCRPSKSRSIDDIIKDVGNGEEQDLKQDTILERGKVYWIQSTCRSIKLPPDVSGRATAKSSIGRLDAMVRLVVANEDQFDTITANKPSGHSPVWIEVVPLTFKLKVSPGMSLSQLRLLRGDDELCALHYKALKHEDRVLLKENGECVDFSEPYFADDIYAVPLRINLAEDPEVGCSGFLARQDVNEPIDPSQSGLLDPTSFWEPVNATGKMVKIEENRFYIFRSKERFRIPEHLAVDCRAYSEGLGDIRIHYAGFAHPLFGRKAADGISNEKGAPLIFEVRGFSMDSFLRDGDVLAKVYFRRMSQPQKSTDGSYTSQELNLSKVFKPWPKLQTTTSP